MTEGKKNYENIQIPETIDQVFQDACKRGRRTLIKRRISKAAMAAAACFCLVLFTGNETIYAKLSELPVIGQIVQFLHSGNGGEITDGAYGYLKGEGGTLQLHFKSETDRTPHYDVRYLEGPERLQITLDGVRQFDREAVQALAEGIEGIRDLYFITYLDDSAVRFAVELEDGYDYLVSEFEQPGYLEISFKKSEAKNTSEKNWFIRSASMEMGEGLALLQETYHKFQAEITKAADGRYAIVIGPFAGKEDAVKVWGEMGGKDSELFLEECLDGRLK